MRAYTGPIELGSFIYQTNNTRGGKISYVRIEGKTFQRVGCPWVVYDFMKQGMNVTLYMHYVPLLGHVIIGVKDESRQIKMFGRFHEMIASCIMAIVMIGAIMILPSLFIGYQLHNITLTMILLCIMSPTIISILLLLDIHRQKMPDKIKVRRFYFHVSID